MNILNTLRLGCAAIALAGGSAPAFAQSEDVLVMRRSITPPKTQAQPPEMTPVEGADTTGYYWVTSDWIRGEEACTSMASETRLRGCVYQGSQADEASCPQPAPETSRMVEDYRACEYQWTITSVGEWAESCAQTTRPAQAECRRLSTGEPVGDEFCTSLSRPTEVSGFNDAGCTYQWAIGEWNDWENQCSANSTRRRSVECTRSDGTVTRNDLCAEEMPQSNETGENYSNCTFLWKPSPWSSADAPTYCGEETSQTRTAVCERIDGQPADESDCTEPKPTLEQFAPDYSTCEYSLTRGDWSDWSSSCSVKAARTRTLTCTREDNQEVEISKCGASAAEGREEKEILTGCSYQWDTGSWTNPKGCSDEIESTRSVSCKRTDGAGVEDSFCSGDKPESSRTISDYSACGYAWKASEWTWDSACSDEANGTRTVRCERGDGTEIDESNCNPATKPGTNTTASNYSNCPADWAIGEWTQWSSQCSSASQRSRNVQCVEQRPSEQLVVGNGECSTQKPSSNEIMGIYSDCQANWREGQWGWNGQAGAKSTTCGTDVRQNRTVTCEKINSEGVLKTVPDEECSETKPATQQTLNPDYSSCSYSWNPGPWSPWSSTCSQNAQRNRTTECLRDFDAQVVSDGLCDSNAEGARTSEVEAVVTDCGGILKNGGFEQGLADWGRNNTYWIDLTDDSYSGTTAALFRGGGSNQLFQRAYTTLPANTTTTISFWCKKLGTKDGHLLEAYGKPTVGSGISFVISENFTCGDNSFKENRFTVNVPVESESITFTVKGRSSATAGSDYGMALDNVLITNN